MTASDPERDARRALLADIDALTVALEKLGVSLREEPLPALSRGGLARVGAQRICFVARDASLEVKRATLVDALRRLPTDELFLHPRLRALLSG